MIYHTRGEDANLYTTDAVPFEMNTAIPRWLQLVKMYNTSSRKD